MAFRKEHGHTAAAWTTVLLVLAGIFIGALAVVLLNWPLFWIGGVGVIVLGLVVGKVMQMMGLGKSAEEPPVGAPDGGPVEAPAEPAGAGEGETAEPADAGAPREGDS